MSLRQGSARAFGREVLCSINVRSPGALPPAVLVNPFGVGVCSLLRFRRLKPTAIHGLALRARKQKIPDSRFRIQDIPDSENERNQQRTGPRHHNRAVATRTGDKQVLRRPSTSGWHHKKQEQTHPGTTIVPWLPEQATSRSFVAQAPRDGTTKSKNKPTAPQSCRGYYKANPSPLRSFPRLRSGQAG